MNDVIAIRMTELSDYETTQSDFISTRQTEENNGMSLNYMIPYNGGSSSTSSVSQYTQRTG